MHDISRRPSTGVTNGAPSPSLRVTRRIHAERLVVLAWPRAILLQLAHPLVAAGVGRHSRFRATPLAPIHRLRHTIGAMLAITYGTSGERADAIAAIQRIHRRVNGPLGAAVGPYSASTRYSAEDSDLLLWVHATLLDSTIRFYERIVAPLDGGDRDVYCAENASAAIELGVRADRVPTTWAALQHYLAGEFASGRIVVSDEARALGRTILWPRFGSLLFPMIRTIRLITIGTLPPELRDAYAFPWTAGDARRCEARLDRLRALRRRLPDRLAWWADYRRGRPAAADRARVAAPPEARLDARVRLR